MIQKRLFIYPGPYHDLMPDHLPQFTSRDPEDINEKFHFGEKFLENKSEYRIVAGTDLDNIPEELKDLELDIDEEITKPIPISKKEFTNPRYNTHLQSVMNKNNRHQQKYNKRYRRK